MEKYNIGLMSLVLFFATGGIICMETAPKRPVKPAPYVLDIRLKNTDSKPALVLIQYKSPRDSQAFIINSYEEPHPIEYIHDIDIVLITRSNIPSNILFSRFNKQKLTDIPKLDNTYAMKYTIYTGDLFTKINTLYNNYKEADILINNNGELETIQLIDTQNKKTEKPISNPKSFIQ